MRTRLHDATPVVRWTFIRDSDVLTCQVHRQGNGRFRLSLIPRAPRGLSGIQMFPSIVSALQRHADICATLRQDGWMVVSYSQEAPTTPTYRPAVAA